jgi:hypothetical protein
MNIKQMLWTDVDSSAIRAVAYSEGMLYIRFNTGQVYLYKNVPLEMYEDLIKADSIGKFHAAKIKNQFEYQKVGEFETPRHS